MASRSLRIGLVLLALSLPLPVSAYLLPEDVLENNQYLLPPTSEEAPIRVRKQQKARADRREREQKANFEAQHPVPPKDEKDFLSPAQHSADTNELSDPTVSNAEILRTARKLDRIEKRQAAIYSSGVLRGRAPMVDTGPATLLMVAPFLAAAGWTWRRAGRKL